MEQEVFLFEKTTSTFTSAKLILDCIWKYIGDPKSIIDVGCGAGGFSKAFEDKDIKDYYLIDHPSLNPDILLISQKDRFIPVDLDRGCPEPMKVDIAICTEVLEHLAPERGEAIVSFLTQCSDCIIFSAAIPRQGGLGHINEKWHVHWHELFAKFDFEYFDGFKPFLLSNQQIDYWLIQNLFIYTKKGKVDRSKWAPNITNDRFQIVSNYILNKEYGVRESFLLLTKAISKFLK
jgi:hypothetical protein